MWQVRHDEDQGTEGWNSEETPERLGDYPKKDRGPAASPEPTPNEDFEGSSPIAATAFYGALVAGMYLIYRMISGHADAGADAAATPPAAPSPSP